MKFGLVRHATESQLCYISDANWLKRVLEQGSLASTSPSVLQHLFGSSEDPDTAEGLPARWEASRVMPKAPIKHLRGKR
jgi:hypothetical protein